MEEEQLSKPRELSGQLAHCSADDVQQDLEELCTVLFGAQSANGLLEAQGMTRLEALRSQYVAKGRPQSTECAVLETLVCLKSMLLRTPGDRSQLKKLIKRLEETLLPTVFMKTSVRPSHLRAALRINTTFAATVAHQSTLDTLKEWREAYQWDFLPPTADSTVPPSRKSLPNIEKENTQDSAQAGTGKVATDKVKSSQPEVRGRGIRPHQMSTNVLPTRGIPSYLITKRGARVRASTPPPTATTTTTAPPSDGERLSARGRDPVYSSSSPLLNEDSNSTLVLESPVKRRRTDCCIVPPSPKRD